MPKMLTPPAAAATAAAATAAPGGRCGSAASEGTTSSTDSFNSTEVAEFLAEIHTELFDHHGAAGKVSQSQLSRALSTMGLESNEQLMQNLWNDAGHPADHSLGAHDLLAHIGQHLVPPSRGSGSASPKPASPGGLRFSKSPKRSPVHGAGVGGSGGGSGCAEAAAPIQQSPACSWWGTQHVAADSA
eukprot:Rhum_TRINITY_DN21911_c0_g1::Rhum_TRINITY_DN21911_c0_g1_i1::g.174948::m.174948